VAAWQPGMGVLNADLSSAHDSRKHAVELVSLVRGLGAAPHGAGSVTEELARLIRLEWQTWGRAERISSENRQLHARLEELRAEV
jgi:hypothetical protein